MIHERNDGKLDFIKIKNICAMKDTLRRMRRQTMDWEEIFARDILDKGLIQNIQKTLKS